MELSGRNSVVILRTNRAWCTLNSKIPNLFNKENVSGESRVELVYKFDEKYYRECLKGESIAKVRFKFFFVRLITLLVCSC